MLEVVIGNRLRDVSRAVISKIDVTDSLEPENFVIVPDRFSMLAEKIMFEELGIKSTFNIQVLGISKLARMFLEENAQLLSAEDCKLIVLEILNSKKWKSFKDVGYSLADEIYKIIAQLKSSKVSCAEFKASTDKKNDEKLTDIAEIFEIYNSSLNGRMDPNDLLDNLEKKIKNISDYNYFFVEFDSLTEQGGAILEKLVKDAKRVVVGAIRPTSQKNRYLYDDDILFKINKIVRDNKITPKKMYVDNKGNLLQNHILQNLYGFSQLKIEKDELYFFEFSTPEEELKNIAKIICFEIKNNQKRYRDFNVLTSELKGNQNIFEKIFKDYDIPFFIDSGILAEEVAPVQFLFLVLNYLSTDDGKLFLALIKDTYSGVSNSDKIENYIKREGSFNLKEISEFGEDEKIFIQNLINLKINMEKRNKCRDFVRLVNEIVVVFNLENKTNEMIAEFEKRKEIKFQKIYQQIFKKIGDSLKTLEIDLEVNIDQFIEIFKSIINEKEIYSIPSSVDCVFIGDATKSYFEEREILFVSGVSQGSLPATVKDYSVLSDKDIETLEDISISPTIKMINKRNKFKLYQNLTLAKEKIIFSYSSTQLGEKVEPASLIKEVKKIFTKEGQEIPTVSSFFNYIAKEKLLEDFSPFDIQNNSDCENEIIELLKNGLKVEDLKKITNNFNDFIFNTDAREKIANAKELFLSKNKISASKIERFYECPFKNFFVRGLSLKENEVCEFDGRDIGNYFHIISENFVKRNCERLKLISPREIKDELEKTLETLYKKERFSRLAKNLKNTHMFAKLKKEGEMLLNQIVYEQKWSDFSVNSKLVEKGFNYSIDGTDFKLTGFVDRVDTSEDFLRVIDYKSGEINQSLADVYYGLEMQLFIYMIAMASELELKPIAGLYMPVGSDFANNKSLKKLVLSGFILGDNKILKKMDKRLNQQRLKSDIVSIKLSTKSEEGNLIPDSRTKNIFTEKGFSAIMEYVKLLVKRAIDEISSGEIKATPCKSKNKTPCLNCPFFSVCSFKGEANGGKYREIKGKWSETNFIDIIKAKEEGKNA